MNVVVLMGRVGADPETRALSDNRVVTNLRLATSRYWNNEAGERQEETSWHRIVLFGRTAEIARDHVRKGDLIGIEGRLRYRQWEDQDGNRRTATEIVAERLHFGARARPGADGDSEPEPSAPAETDAGEDEAPF